MDFLDNKIEEYAEKHTTDESEVLKKLNRETHAKVLHPRMLSGHLQGRLLSFISKMVQPKRILEIGTYTGYSAICMAEGLSPDGQLHTIDIDEELYDMVESYKKAAGFEKQIVQHIGNALEVIPTLKEKWDIVFIDADKSNYGNYYNLLIDQLLSGAIIIADNVLWSGKVIDEPNSKDEDTAALIKFNEELQNDERIENVLMTIRDGLMICRKK